MAGCPPAAHGEDLTLEQLDVPEDGRDSMGKYMLEQPVPEDLWPMERTHAREVRGEVSPMGGTPHWSRGRVRSPPPEEEGAAETCDELTTIPIPHLPVVLWREEVVKIGSEVEPGKEGRVEGKCFKVYFYFLITLL